MQYNLWVADCSTPQQNFKTSAGGTLASKGTSTGGTHLSLLPPRFSPHEGRPLILRILYCKESLRGVGFRSTRGDRIGSRISRSAMGQQKLSAVCRATFVANGGSMSMTIAVFTLCNEHNSRSREALADRQSTAVNAVEHENRRSFEVLLHSIGMALNIGEEQNDRSLCLHPPNSPIHK